MTRPAILLPGTPAALRPWRLDDGPALQRAADDRRIARTLRDSFPWPYTLAEADRWLLWATTRIPVRELAVTVDDVPVGGIGYVVGEDVHHRSAEVGYWLAPAWWGRGIATAAVRALAGYAFDAEDLLRLHAMVFANNPASMRVLEKAGWAREGVLRHHVSKDGTVLDVVLYATVRDP